VALLVTAAAMGAACGGSSPDVTTTVPVTVTATETATATVTTTTAAATTEATGKTIYNEQNTTVDVATGDSFTIELPVNPSTGYAWVASPPMGYVQVSNEIVPLPADAAVGAPTVERWVFSADTPGTGNITFDLYPPGSGKKSEQTVDFTVNAS